MENEQPQAQKIYSKKSIIIASAVIVIIIVGVIVLTVPNSQSRQENAVSDQTQQQQQQISQKNENMEKVASYADGTYEAIGSYTSPGGEESIDVSITLADGVVTKAEVVSNATRPVSQQMQNAFIEGFKEQVVGKNIDEINVTKVSGSSLTPKGFMDALQKIKQEAAS